ncbi:MAG: tetratricopeptide repeat protein [Rhodospirillaceae bacterium]
MMTPSFKLASLAFALLIAAHAVRAQEADVAAELQCLRYLQSHERNLRIPQGLLTAISLTEAGRADANGSLVAWPWTINAGGKGQYFATKEEAVAAARKLLDEGQRSIDVGCMQINLRFHPNAFPTIEDAFDPATNVAYGAQFLASLHKLQGSWSKAVERYHSSDDGRREEYRERVMFLWNSEARNLVMNAVLAEDTDTPYHRAIRDFAAGRFAEALDKYQAIVDARPNDRIGLLGVAMSYEELGREAEAMQAYGRYLAAEPSNQNVLSKMIQSATSKAPDAARAELESFLKAGVAQPDLYAALAEIASTLGDNDAAFTYASDAVARAPDVPAYYLNAGVLADKLSRPAAAVQFYERFLELFERQPVLVDTSVDGIRERARFLRAKL